MNLPIKDMKIFKTCAFISRIKCVTQYLFVYGLLRLKTCRGSAELMHFLDSNPHMRNKNANNRLIFSSL